MRRIVAIALASLCLSLPAAAQERECSNQNGEYDPALSADWKNQLAASDPTAMTAISGVWRHQFDKTADGYVEVQVQRFFPDGLFEYQSRVCFGIGNDCKDREGHGIFTAHDEGGGIFVAVNYSDDTHAYSCIGFTVRLDGTDQFSTDSGVWTRVR
ncbi:hypothetical protein [Oryzibacter oryziterrae]|uniref:hypothetical protein n=1 Tax=Oryzibacter oryziterrae TaxID=2766474 RepID=UPI001F3A39EC|nr:hypothetical protein [Oryzibacter oryziterrae]